MTQSKQYKDFMAEIHPLIALICGKAGVPEDDWDFWCLSRIFFVSMSDRDHGLELPDWLDEEVLAQLVEAVERGRQLVYFSDPQVAKFFVGGGAFVHLVLDNMRAFVSGHLTSKFNVIYAHDTTMLGFLANVNYSDTRSVPSYSSCLNFELYTEDDGLEYYVDVLFKKDTGSMEMEKINLEYCPRTGPCPWNLFLTSLEKLELTNPGLACRYSAPLVTWVAVSVVAMAVVTAVISITKDREAKEKLRKCCHKVCFGFPSFGYVRKFKQCFCVLGFGTKLGIQLSFNKE